MTLLQRICGCSEGAIHWRYGYHDFTKPSHMLAYRVLRRWEYVRHELPWNAAWSLADILSRLANRLRGHPTYHFSYSGGIEGNEAAKLADDLHLKLIYRFIDEDDRDSMNESMEDLARLAQLARETWWHEKPKDFPKAS